MLIVKNINMGNCCKK
jgi:hypothetical protein